MDKNTIERLRKRASQHFLDSIAVKQEAEKVLPESVAVGVLAMVECLRTAVRLWLVVMADPPPMHNTLQPN